MSAGLIGGVAAATGRGEPRVEAVRAPDELKLTYLAAGVGTVRPVAPVEVEPLAPAPEVVAAPSVPQRASRVAVAPAKRTWSGYASWYGNELAGNRTANGEVFDPNALTAAHRTLPFGSRVRVTNPRNGRSVEVRINDRGPHVAGREIDLSRAAAEAIGVRARGGGTVTLELL